MKQNLTERVVFSVNVALAILSRGSFLWEALSGKMGLLPYLAITVPVGVIICSVLLKIEHHMFEKTYALKKSLHIPFLWRLLQATTTVLVALSIIFGYAGSAKLWQMLFGSTVIVSAVVGFAAQDILKDVLAGLIISFFKPFDIGDRLYVPDIPKPVIVEDMSIRHVVLRGKDGMHYVIPNSQMNTKVVTHTNWDHGPRATYLSISIAYSSNMALAIQLIRQAVMDCPYTCPNNWANKDLNGYGDVYITGYGASGFNLEVTIWSEPGTDNDLAVSQVYASIAKLFAKNGIEIPYNYVNVITRENDEMFTGMTVKQSRQVRREVATKSDSILLKDKIGDTVSMAIEETQKFATFHQFSASNSMTLELLTEELISFTSNVAGNIRGRFWIEGNRHKVNICVRFKMNPSIQKHSEFINLSSNSESNQNISIWQKLQDRIISGINGRGALSFSLSADVPDDQDRNDLEKLLITKMSDDVFVSIHGKQVEIQVIKKF